MILVQVWLFSLASATRSSIPAFPEHHRVERLAPAWIWSGRMLIVMERIAKGDRDIKVQVLRNPRIALAFSGFHMEAMHEPMPSSQTASCIYAVACPRSKPSAVEAMSAMAKGAPARCPAYTRIERVAAAFPGRVWR